MNLLDISYFGHGKNVGLYVKQLLSRVHGGILWMDKSVQLDVVLIVNIKRFPISGTHLEDYLDNKACEKEIIDLVKSQFGTHKEIGVLCSNSLMKMQ
jgi:hypothetical protein